MSLTDNWSFLKDFTKARIALGRNGVSLPTKEILNFSLAHAQARDAVHKPFDSQALQTQLTPLELTSLTVHSCAKDRNEYLRRPDLGRTLDQDSINLLKNNIELTPADLIIVIGDGLSSFAVDRQAIKVVKALLPYLKKLNISLGPIVLAHQARVALGDKIGSILKAKAIVMLIGERPGLSSADSLGIYMTWHPDDTRTDADRNCISNVRPEGLTYDLAAFKLAWLLEHSFVRQLSGVQLKDESDYAALPSNKPLYIDHS
ncbi:ethanolamine ammonia-lyase subunit EutC [Commensalibacter oyaizuii]|uniref:Ethanolamine ammonia-lyase small subunit n=1 Tax=Commensalibacter oyaizuii TaxID=3043873 RepID=A0ABT6Q3U6_9PROT|nr:ethanolamine ammonia-lyase subunit EutC [Commensalibacter sp. TBRC 16381]MDI2091785.1 ethanolamine ammonia-lyase subunit EutC [Commensalibacter sp. TBRC 16381]